MAPQAAHHCAQDWSTEKKVDLGSPSHSEWTIQQEEPSPLARGQLEKIGCSRTQLSKPLGYRGGLETLGTRVLKDKNVLKWGDVLPTTT